MWLLMELLVDKIPFMQDAILQGPWYIEYITTTEFRGDVQKFTTLEAESWLQQEYKQRGVDGNTVKTCMEPSLENWSSFSENDCKEGL